MPPYCRLKVGAVHAAPAFLDVEGTIDRIADWAKRAAREGVDVLAFGESFLPGFPIWNLVLRPVEQHGLFRRLVDCAVEIPGRECSQLSSIAAKAGIVMSVGITEKSAVTLGTMWNANLVFGEDGRLLSHHRKILPTWAEKLTWANGDGSELRVVETRVGRLGCLICGENTNPLARYALLAQGEQIHVSTYPPAWPFSVTGRGPEYDLAESIRIRAAAHSFEGKVFNIVAGGVVGEDMVRAVGDIDERAGELIEKAPRSVSMVVGPDGERVSDVMRDEGLVMADIDVGQSIALKAIHDVAGGQNRFDLFSFQMNAKPYTAIEICGAIDDRDYDHRTMRSEADPVESLGPEYGESGEE